MCMCACACAVWCGAVRGLLARASIPNQAGLVHRLACPSKSYDLRAKSAKKKLKTQQRGSPTESGRGVQRPVVGRNAGRCCKAVTVIGEAVGEDRRGEGVRGGGRMGLG